MLAKRLAEFPFVSGVRAMHDDPLDALLAGTWRPALSITGAAGLPSPTDGGNVLRPMTAAKLSLRLPPTVSSAHAAKRLKETLEAAPPYGVRVRFEAETPGDGWDAPARRRGSRRRCAARRRTISAGPRCRRARAARSRSWRCWARAIRRRSS